MINARVDDNQSKIVGELRQVGCRVLSLAKMGKGCPDLLCAWQGRNYLFEVKNPDKPPSARKLTPDEQEFFNTWKPQGQVDIIYTADDALRIMGIIE